MVFFVLLAVPLLVILAGYLFSKGKVSPKEVALQLAVQLVVAGAAAFIVHYSSVHDTEVWNGSVTSKASERVSCSHSYQCNCITTQNCDSKGNCTPTTICQTCYEHDYDVDWNVQTSNAEKITIDRIDRQGVYEPPRFTSVVLGEPTTVEHGYTNYIKASPGTLFRHQGLVEKFKASIPRYPEVYDYYRMNRLILVGGVKVQNTKEWVEGLSRLNAEVGRPKQANIIVVLAKGLPQEYFYALEEAWIGAKKNDIVLVIGVDYLTPDTFELTPTWATVMAWTSQEIFKVRLRDDVMSAGPLSTDVVIDILKKDVTQLYVRKPMAEFEYLEASITPTPLQWGISLGVSLLISIVLTFICIKYDLFGDERRRSYTYNPNYDFDVLKRRY